MRHNKVEIRAVISQVIIVIAVACSVIGWLGFFYKVELRIRSKISVKERVWLIAKYFRETLFPFDATTIVNEGG